MISFPKTTYIGKKLPKESFYSNLTLSTVIKRAFVDDIEQIIWLNFLTSTSLNVGKGDKVNQVDILHITLKKQDCNYVVFDTIENAIPRHLIFLLNFNDKFLLYVNYKEEYQKGKFKIIDTFKSDWLNEAELSLVIKGLDLDQVYDNLVFQIAGQKVAKVEGVDLKVAVESSQKIEKTKKKIAELEVKKRNEKQFNIQLRISNEIKKLQKQLLQCNI